MYEWLNDEWIQVGRDNVGEPTSDGGVGGGVAMSTDGNPVAIGTEYFSTGQVRVYGLVGGRWIQVGSDIRVKGGAFRSRRSMIAVSSDLTRIAISASPVVRVYALNGTSWNQVGSGIHSLADGNRIAIGAPDNDANGGSFDRVRVYEWIGAA